MKTKLKGTIHFDFDHSRVEGGQEIEGIPFAMIVIGNREFDISAEVEVLTERHSQGLESAIDEKEAAIYAGMRN